MTDDLVSPFDYLNLLDDAALAERTADLPGDDLAGLLASADLMARDGQIAPAGEWATWLILAGRGFGKTFAGARFIDERARSVAGARLAIVGATLGDARSVMVEGDAGVLAVARERPRFEPALRRLSWTNGSTAMLYGAAEPDSLRGPAFHFAWGDEIAKWDAAEPALANLALATRLGRLPRRVLTTTPRPLRWLQALAAPAAGVIVTRGQTVDNRANLPAAYIAGMMREFGGTRLARQELHGEIVVDLEGALWTRDLLDRCRVAAAPDGVRTVIGVDPPAGEGGKVDACGIVVVRLGPDGRAYVIADRTVQGLSSLGWASVVDAVVQEYGADRVVVEVNNGGAMIGTILHQVNDRLPLKNVTARVGKVARAEPVATLYERGKVAHVGMFAALEDELCGLLTGGAYAGPGRSPDRADALVWALTELMLGKVRTPQVRTL